jgi:hypothetical protein
MAGKLFIYDTGDANNVDQADGRFSAGYDVTEIATDSVAGLLNGLDGLVRRRATFDRLLVQTHGSPGTIYFGNESILPYEWNNRFAGRGYHLLFPTYTRIYFDGCNVGAADIGTRFLTAAGQVFTRIAGGEVFAFTNPGYGFPGWVPFIGGHTIHVGAPLKKVFLLAGGVVFGVQSPSSAPRYRFSTR